MWARKILSLLTIVILIGFVLILLPDSNKRLFSISKDHGPSILDAIGLVLILFPYILLIVKAWKNRSRLANYHDKLIFKFGIYLFGIGTGLVIASVANDCSFWWIIGAILMLGVQIPLFIKTLK